MQILAMDGDFHPLVLPDSPSVLSVGIRCMEENYEFHWERGSAHPYFISPKGKKIVCHVDQYVPYVIEKTGSAIMAGTDPLPAPPTPPAAGDGIPPPGGGPPSPDAGGVGGAGSGSVPAMIADPVFSITYGTY